MHLNIIEFDLGILSYQVTIYFYYFMQIKKEIKVNGHLVLQIQCRPPVGTGATGAKAPINFEQRVPGTRPETECTYHKFSNEGYNCL